MKVFYLIISILFWLPFSSHSTSTPDQIYHQLKVLIGDTNADWPELKIWDRERSVAGYRSPDNAIILEQKAVSICRQFGNDSDAAIAYLIGHELTHFYQKHQWDEMGFSSTYLMGQKTFNLYREQELEADIYGAFVAYVAGYDVRKILAPLLDSIYRNYEITPGATQNYPSLDERKEVAYEVILQVNKLINLYEFGHIFSAVNQYYVSALCYEYILKFLKFKELYQNLACAYFRAALQSGHGEAFQFQYPIHIDREFPLRRVEPVDHRQMLELAKKYFFKAIEMDPNYPEAIYGFVSVFILEGNLQKAGSLLNDLTVRGMELSADQNILQGVICALRNDKEGSMKYFDEALSQKREKVYINIVRYNKNILNNQPFIPPDHGFTEYSGNWVISYESDGANPQYINLPSHDPLFEYQVSLVGNSGVSRLELNHDLFKVELQRISTPAIQHNIPVKIGDSSLLLVDHFGDPHTTLHNKGYFACYRDKNIIFDIMGGKIQSIIILIQ